MAKRDARSVLLSRLPVYEQVRQRLAKKSAPERPIVGEVPSLAEFVRKSWPVLEGGSEPDWNWHMESIALHCQEIFLDWVRHREDSTYIQRTRNLVIEVPPGSAKSRIVSVCFPAWAWLQCPSWRVICLSSNPRVALRDSLYCRDLIESEWYQKGFSPSWHLRYDQNTKSLFSNTAGGWRKALGFGSKITGDRGDCLLCDDPHDASDVNSDVKRNSVIDRWDSAISNRVNDLRSSIRLGIMQRLREDDWAGHVKTLGWDALTIPQEYEGESKPTVFGWRDPRTTIGELMFPKRFPPDILEGEKLRLGAGYSGQHQQKPVASGGGMFRIVNWRLYNPDKMPPLSQSILSVDATFKDSANADYVAILCISKSREFSRYPTIYKGYSESTLNVERQYSQHYRYYLRDLWRAQADIDQTEAAIEDMARKHPYALSKVIETKANGEAIITQLSKRLRGMTGYNPKDSKPARATAVQPIQSRGDIYIPIAPWAIPAFEAMKVDSCTIGEWWENNPPPHKMNAEHCPIDDKWKVLVNEAAMFPLGANDDCVDAMVQACLWLEANSSPDWIGDL